MLHTIKKKCF